MPAGRGICRGPVFLAPSAQAAQYRYEGLAGLSQHVVIAWRMLAVLLAGDHAAVFQLAQPGGEHLPESAGAALDLGEAAHPEPDLADDQQRPPVADQGGSRDRRLSEGPPLLAEILADLAGLGMTDLHELVVEVATLSLDDDRSEAPAEIAAGRCSGEEARMRYGA